MEKRDKLEPSGPFVVGFVFLDVAPGRSGTRPVPAGTKGTGSSSALGEEKQRQTKCVRREEGKFSGMRWPCAE